MRTQGQGQLLMREVLACKSDIERSKGGQRFFKRGQGAAWTELQTHLSHDFKVSTGGLGMTAGAASKLASLRKVLILGLGFAVSRGCALRKLPQTGFLEAVYAFMQQGPRATSDVLAVLMKNIQKYMKIKSLGGRERAKAAVAASSRCCFTS